MKKRIIILYVLTATKMITASTAYVVNRGGNNVLAVDTTTNMISATIPGGSVENLIAITPNGAYAYVTNQAGGTFSQGNVTVINTANNTIFATINDASFNSPSGVAISPNGIVYVANTSSGANTVSYFPAGVSSPTVQTIPVGSNPQGVAITPNGQYLYVANQGSSNVSVYDISGASPVFFATISGFDGAFGIAITPDGSTVYLTDFTGGHTVYYFATGQTTPTINSITVGTNPAFLAITTDGLFAYVANFSSNTVSMISLPATVVATISVGANPVAAAITSNDSTVYVTDFGGANVAHFPAEDTTPTVQFIAGFSSPLGIAITRSGITASGGIWDILVQFANALGISFSPTSGDRSLAATIAPHSPFNVTVSPLQGLWDIVFNMGTAVGSSPSPEQGVRELLVNMAPFV